MAGAAGVARDPQKHLCTLQVAGVPILRSAPLMRWESEQSALKPWYKKSFFYEQEARYDFMFSGPTEVPFSVRLNKIVAK